MFYRAALETDYAKVLVKLGNKLSKAAALNIGSVCLSMLDFCFISCMSEFRESITNSSNRHILVTLFEAMAWRRVPGEEVYVWNGK